MNYWIKNIGSHDDPLPPRWFEVRPEEEFRTHVRFGENSKPTGIAKNDLLLFSAAIANQAVRRLVAVVRVTDDQAVWQPRTASDKWPWGLAISPRLVVPLGGLGPTLADIGITSVIQGSHAEMAGGQFALAVRLMVRSALPDALKSQVPEPT
jgi:hypothetical protein